MVTLLSRALRLRSIASRNACTLLSLRPATGVLRGAAGRLVDDPLELDVRLDALDPRVDALAARLAVLDVRFDPLDPRVEPLDAGLRALDELPPLELEPRFPELPPVPLDLDPPDLVAIRFLLA
jgi:hypothetical protein